MELFIIYVYQLITYDSAQTCFLFHFVNSKIRRIIY